MTKIHKGDRIRYTATISAEYPYDPNLQLYLPPGVTIIASPDRISHGAKCLVRYPTSFPENGVVIGKTCRAVGIYSSGHRGGWYNDDWEEASLQEHQRVTLWLVEPITLGNDRYCQPVLVHEDDIRLDLVSQTSNIVQMITDMEYDR